MIPIAVTNIIRDYRIGDQRYFILKKRDIIKEHLRYINSMSGFSSFENFYDKWTMLHYLQRCYNGTEIP